MKKVFDDLIYFKDINEEEKEQFKMDVDDILGDNPLVVAVKPDFDFE